MGRSGLARIAVTFVMLLGFVVADGSGALADGPSSMTPSTGYSIELRPDPHGPVGYVPVTLTVSGPDSTKVTDTYLHGSEPRTVTASALPGTYQVSVAGPGVQKGSTSFEVLDGRISQVAVDVLLIFQARGRVVDTSNHPLGGQWVRAMGADDISAVAVTSADGTFHLSGLDAGTYSLVNSERSGYAPVDRQFEVDGETTTELGDVRFGLGVVVAGRLLDERGQPVVLVDVWAQQKTSRGDWANTVLTDGQGRFRVTGMTAGDIDVIFSSVTSLPRTVHVTATADARVDLGDVRIKRAARLYVEIVAPGRLLAADPMPLATVSLYPVVNGSRSARPVSVASSGAVPGTPFADFSPVTLAPGRYVVRVTGSMGTVTAAPWETTVDLAGGEDRHLRHTYSFGRPITVTALGPTGAYLRGRAVVAMEVACTGTLPAPRHPNGSAVYQPTDAGGRSVLATLPRRCYDLGGADNIYDPYVPVVRRVAAGTSGIVFHDDYANTAGIEASKLAYGKRSIVVDVRVVHQAHGGTPVVRGGKVAVYEHEDRVTTWGTVKDGKAHVRFLHSPKPGKHTYHVDYEGTTGMQGAWKFDHVLVGHAPAKVTVKTASLRRWYRGTVTVAVSAGVTPKGKVVAYVGGRKVGSATVHKVDGKYVAKVPVGVVTTRGGSLKVTVEYSGNASVSKASTTRKVTVRR